MHYRLLTEEIKNKNTHIIYIFTKVMIYNSVSMNLVKSIL